MSASQTYLLILQDRLYRIHTRTDCSRLRIYCAERNHCLGVYEPRWLGSSRCGGYWKNFRSEIPPDLLLGMSAIARIIDGHRRHEAGKPLSLDLKPLAGLEGSLRAVAGMQAGLRIAA